ncbi:hypothetical protein B0H14DRAFT_2886875 [Mycena olivaceomarginata]|nr:hypothetical protein B0H14DRAFT_2886875 [Mycena olivaceomarginata]
MTFPSAFDAFVPSNGPDFLAVSTIQPDYVPFTILSAVPINTAAHAASFAYSKKLTPPASFLHVLRCFYFALALLYTGFPSGTPGELSLRLYHTHLAPRLGLLHGAFMAYEHLHAAAPDLDAQQVGDIVQSIVLHTSQWPALFDIGGYNGTGLVGLDFSRLWHPKTIEEIEKAYPRGNLYQEGLSIFDREFVQKPQLLALDALVKDLRVGPIVPEDSRARNVRGLKDPHFRHSE